MPCTGPDLNAERKFGIQVGEQLFEELVRQYDITPPFCLPNADKRWNKAKSTFIKSVGELFVEGACNSF